MLEAYVIAEVASILENAYVETYGQRLDIGAKENLNKMARVSLPALDNYFSHRLKVDALKIELDDAANRIIKVEQDKSSNDADYLELSARNNQLQEDAQLFKSLLKILVSKEGN